MNLNILYCTTHTIWMLGPMVTSLLIFSQSLFINAIHFYIWIYTCTEFLQFGTGSVASLYISVHKLTKGTLQFTTKFIDSPQDKLNRYSYYFFVVSLFILNLYMTWGSTQQNSLKVLSIKSTDTVLSYFWTFEQNFTNTYLH